MSHEYLRSFIQIPSCRDYSSETLQSPPPHYTYDDPIDSLTFDTI